LFLQAQKLLSALARRQLYKYVQEVTLSAAQQAAAAGRGGGPPSAEEIIGFQSSAMFGVRNNRVLMMMVMMVMVMMVMVMMVMVQGLGCVGICPKPQQQPQLIG
jgi:hypothetical protein